MGSASYAVEVTRAHVYPVYARDEYTRWMSDTAHALGFRTFVRQDVLSLISSGRIVAVGDLEVEVGDAGGGGCPTWERVASFWVADTARNASRVLRSARIARRRQPFDVK